MRRIDLPASLAERMAAMADDAIVVTASDLARYRDLNDTANALEAAANRALSAAREKRDAAWSEGHALGLSEGREEGRVAATAEVLSGLCDWRAELAARAATEETRVAALAVALAKRLVGDLPVAWTIVASAARAAVENELTGRAVLHVPTDLAGPASERLAALAVDPGAFEIVPDAALAPGDGRLETGIGTIALDLERELDLLAEALAPEEAEVDRDASTSGPVREEAP